jgi:hypothetical protein
MKKFRQVRDGNGIIAFWSDNEDLEDLEFAFAVADIREDVDRQIQTLPTGFLFSVFASDWVSRHQQIYCQRTRTLQEPYSGWADDLQSSYVNDCIQRAIRRFRGGTLGPQTPQG